MNAWAFRIKKELERSFNPLFVTLTYNDENLPRISSGEPTLLKRDVQLFLKNLRFQNEKIGNLSSLRYYLCGEYGKKFKRPHYHIILFNCPSVNLIHGAWGRGHTLSLPLLNGGIGYVLKYMSKSSTPKKKGEKQPEFSLMSKNLGDNYLTPQMLNYHRNRVENCYLTIEGGVKMSLPKYYKEKIYTDEYKELRLQVTKYLDNRNKQHLDDLINKFKKRYPHRDENFYLNLVEQSKNLSKLVPRQNEIF